MKANNINCPNCGARNKSDIIYCEYCGTQLRESTFWDTTKNETEVIKLNNKFLIVFVGVFIYFIFAFTIKNNEISNNLFSQDNINSIIQFFMTQFHFDDFSGLNNSNNLFSLLGLIYASFSRRILYIMLFFIADLFIFWGASNGVDAKRQSIWRAFWTTILVTIATLLFIGCLSLFSNGLIALGIILFIFITPAIIKANHQTTYGGGMGILLIRLIIITMSVEFIFLLYLY